MQTIFGMLRIRNEARWISRVLRSIQPLCAHTFILDDNSEDDTVDLCRQFPNVTVFRSPFQGIDEQRDKNWLLQRLFDAIPECDQHYLAGNPDSPYFALAIDGDEELMAEDVECLRRAVTGPEHVYSLQVLYLWDRENQVRVDGVYANFRRPSLFRLVNRDFTYMSTPWGNGANFHCSNIPQELLHYSTTSSARLLHYGYIDREMRLRKYEFYNRVDPSNHGEDCYRHMVQGDVPEIPPDMRLRWAGPLQLQPLEVSIPA